MILPFSPYLPYRAHARRIGNLTEQRVVIHLQAFYIASNGVTVKCPGVAVGASFTLGGVTYTKRDRAALDALVAASSTDEVELARSCTSGVTDMSQLFGSGSGSKVSDPTTFNPDLSSWDTSSVTDMSFMFRVRVPPSRVLLL